MHIGAAGPSGPEMNPPILAASTANIPQSNLETLTLEDDTLGALLQQMSATPVAQLITGLQSNHSPADPTIVTNLLRNAVASALDGNIPAAMAALTELIHQSPQHIETLAAEPGLEPIRAQVVDLLTRVTVAAKMDAELKLATATQAVDSAKPHSARPGDWNPREVLPVAERLIGSGVHSNILLGADLSQSIINYYGGFEVESKRLVDERKRKDLPHEENPPGEAPWSGAFELLRNTWRKTPLLLLLFLWVALGLLAAIAVGIELWSVELSLEVWGAGSAGLLGFGTYRRMSER